MTLFKNSNITLWIIGVIFIGASLIIVGRSGTSPSDAVAVPVNPDLLVIASDDYSKGAPEGVVTLIEYIDFECEACGAYYPLVKQLEQEFPDDLKVVLRYFPLPNHRNGMTAALAAEAAGRQGKFLEMHDLLFTEQKNWGEKAVATPAVFEGYAQQLGLDMEKFKADVASVEVKARVERDINSGKELGNTGTPSFFLNNERLPNPSGYDAFKAIIQAEIDSVKNVQMDV